MKNHTAKTATVNTREHLKVMREAKKTAGQAATKLIEAEAAVRAEHDALLEQRKEINFRESSYASEMEVVENIDRLVDEQAAKFANSFATRFVRDLGGHRELKRGALRDIQPHLPNFGSLGGEITFENLCGLAPSLVKESLKQMVQKHGKFGRPKAERDAARQAIEENIAEIEEAHTQLVEWGEGVGIKLSLLDTVLNRRSQDAQAARIANQHAEDAARGVFTAEGASVGGV